MTLAERWTPETEELVSSRGAGAHAARDILEALADAGLLLPPGGEEETRFGLSIGVGWGYLHVCERGEATNERKCTKWPDGSEFLGPWEVTPDA
jgi:hypothetical protein